MSGANGETERGRSLSVANRYLERWASTSASGFKGYGERPTKGPSPWATADGLLGILLSGGERDSEVVRACQQVLYDTFEEQPGGWASRGVVNVDATAMVVSALSLVLAPEPRYLVAATEFILASQSSGGFALAPGLEPRIFTTSMAMWALSQAQRFLPDKLAKRALAARLEASQWLHSASCKVGGWNEVANPDFSPSVPFTGIALFGMNFAPDPGAVASSREYGVLWLRQQPAQAAQHVVELRTVGADEEQELRTVHLYLPWKILGLASAPKPQLDDVLRSAVSDLLDEQIGGETADSGAFPWVHEDHRRELTIWSTFRSVHAISAVEDLEQRQATANTQALAYDIPLRLDELAGQVEDARMRVRRQTWAMSILAVIVAVLVGVSSLPDSGGDAAATVGELARKIWDSQGIYGVMFTALLGLLVLVLRWIYRRLRPSEDEPDISPAT